MSESDLRRTGAGHARDSCFLPRRVLWPGLDGDEGDDPEDETAGKRPDIAKAAFRPGELDWLGVIRVRGFGCVRIESVS